MARRPASAGFTLIELVLVMIVLGIMATYSIGNMSASVYTVASQAESLARDIRHAQSLATTWGRSLRISTSDGSNGTYSVACVTTGTSPCNVSPVVDPATGRSFSGAALNGVALAGPATPLQFDSAGKPSAAASFTLTAGSFVKTVNVAALTGIVTVTP